MNRLVVLGLLCFAVAINLDPPPKHPATNFAAEARRMVHHANSTGVTLFFLRISPIGAPFVWSETAGNSTVANSSTGDLFFFMMGKDLIAMDVDDRLSIEISFKFSDEKEGGCKTWNGECPSTYIQGTVNKLDKESEKYVFGLDALLRRLAYTDSLETVRIPRLNVSDEVLPSSSFIADKFYLCTLDILHITIFTEEDYEWVTPEDYYAGTDPVDVKEV